MKITCDYCGNIFDDTNAQCPNCSAPNPGVVRTAKEQPITIEQLKQWYIARGLPPYSVTRFFIGTDCKEPKAFGIYKNEKTGKFVVYKNKADGTRAVRYEGTDEAYAVNEIYMRLKQEILQQKQHANSPRSNSTSKSSSSYPFSRNRKYTFSRLYVIIIAIIVIFNVVPVMGFGITACALHNISNNDVKQGYYQKDGQDYYHLSYDDDWYWYDSAINDWSILDDDSVPVEFNDKSTASDFYYTPTWNSDTQFTDFETTDFYEAAESAKAAEAERTLREYEDRWEDRVSNYDYDWSNDSSYDWDSGSSWDSDSSWDSGSSWDLDW